MQFCGILAGAVKLAGTISGEIKKVKDKKELKEKLEKLKKAADELKTKHTELKASAKAKMHQLLSWKAVFPILEKIEIHTDDIYRISLDAKPPNAKHTKDEAKKLILGILDDLEKEANILIGTLNPENMTSDVETRGKIKTNCDKIEQSVIEVNRYIPGLTFMEVKVPLSAIKASVGMLQGIGKRELTPQ